MTAAPSTNTSDVTAPPVLPVPVLAAAMERSGLALAVLDADGRLVHVTHGLTRMLGVGAEDLLGRHRLQWWLGLSVLLPEAEGHGHDDRDAHDDLTPAQRAVLSGAMPTGLDVLSEEPPPADHPIFEIPNTVLSPHMAGPTWQSWPRRFENSFANIVRVERGEPAQWVVEELHDLFPPS